MSAPALFPYQIAGVEYLKDKRCRILGDDMGLGKSAQAITAADLSSCDRILVVCPAVARENWRREFELFSVYKRPFQIITSAIKDIPQPQNSLIYSYDGLVAHQRDGVLAEQKFDLLILDEAHFLKNPTTLRTKWILGNAGVVRQCAKTWALTGTPMPNHPGELWPLLHTFGATKKSYEDFVERYCETITATYGQKEYVKIVGMKEECEGELQWLLSRIMLRRRKSEVLKDLPHVFVNPYPVARGKVSMSPEMLEKVETELQKLEMDLEGVSPAHQMAILEGSAQSVTTLRRYIGLQKVAGAISLVEQEMEVNYKKLVVFCVHKEVAASLQAAFNKVGFWPAMIVGDTPGDRRQKEVDRFQRDPRCKVFVGNIQAAGVAITLTAANEVLFVEQEWTPASNEQAIARCHRIGQSRNVNVRILTVADSVDERVSDVLRRKNSDITKLFG